MQRIHFVLHFTAKSIRKWMAKERAVPSLVCAFLIHLRTLTHSVLGRQQLSCQLRIHSTSRCSPLLLLLLCLGMSLSLFCKDHLSSVLHFISSATITITRWLLRLLITITEVQWYGVVDLSNDRTHFNCSATPKPKLFSCVLNSSCYVVDRLIRSPCNIIHHLSIGGCMTRKTSHKSTTWSHYCSAEYRAIEFMHWCWTHHPDTIQEKSRWTCDPIYPQITTSHSIHFKSTGTVLLPLPRKRLQVIRDRDKMITTEFAIWYFYVTSSSVTT